MREDGTKHSSSASQSPGLLVPCCSVPVPVPVSSVLRVLAAADRWVLGRGTPGRLWIAHIRAAGSLTPPTLTLPTSPPTHHHHHQPRDTNICVSVATVPPPSGRRQVLRMHMV